MHIQGLKTAQLSVDDWIGEVAEWSIATVLKTVGPKGPGGSNPSLSAILRPTGFGWHGHLVEPICYRMHFAKDALRSPQGEVGPPHLS